MLNVSRQYVVRLLNEGGIPFRNTGKHRRLLATDVLAFKEKRDKDRRAGLRELSQLTEVASEIASRRVFYRDGLLRTGRREQHRTDRSF